MSSSGSTLYDVIASGVERLDSELGLSATDGDDYRVFWPLFKPVLASHHGVREREVRQPRHEWGALDKVSCCKNHTSKRIKAYDVDDGRGGGCHLLVSV